MGKVGTTIAFRVRAPDGESMEPVFSTILGNRDLNSLPNFRAYARSFGTLGQTRFSMSCSLPQATKTSRYRERRANCHVSPMVATESKQGKRLPLLKRHTARKTRRSNHSVLPVETLAEAKGAEILQARPANFGR